MLIKIDRNYLNKFIENYQCQVSNEGRITIGHQANFEENPEDKDEETHPFEKLRQKMDEINTKLGEIAETQRKILEEIKK